MTTPDGAAPGLDPAAPGPGLRIPVRVVVDLLGGDRPPADVAAGALLAAQEFADVKVVLVGPPDIAASLPTSAGPDGRVQLVEATDVVGMGDDPVQAVRAKQGASVRVAARLLRDRQADAMVTVGSTGAALAASLFTLGRLPGITRPALAVVVPALAHSVILLDAGANTDVSPDLLAQFALSGAAYARTGLGLAVPRVGLLSIGAEVGKGDGLRKQAHRAIETALRGLPIDFVGNVEGDDVPLGGRADVVVTDGFCGNVLLKGLEGTHRLMTEAISGALARRQLSLGQLVADAGRPLPPDRLGGGVLLGVRGVVVVGHGASGPRAVASCVGLAAQAARAGLLAGVEDALAELVTRRRLATGLTRSSRGAPERRR